MKVFKHLKSPILLTETNPFYSFEGNKLFLAAFANRFCYSHPWRLNGLNSHRISESANIICILLMEMWNWGYAGMFKLEGLVLSRKLQTGFVVTLGHDFFISLQNCKSRRRFMRWWLLQEGPHVTGYVEKDTVTETEKNEKNQQGYGCDARRFRGGIEFIAHYRMTMP
ncbi:hypothetical protein MTR_7g012380 [Medicago truncatula]|uniref:Uncharacterized protein n=1 Tax=Medicago truncatula TaxID=3880 RepID=G7L463_MEDTR|nr:hypothetical protein MTR_7g012380 [Medicago truncatula]